MPKKQSTNNQISTKQEVEQEIKEVKQRAIKEKEQEKKEEKQEKKAHEDKSQKAAEKTKIKIPPRTAILFIQATKNNTHVTLTDITGSEILVKSSGGQIVKNKAQRDEQAAAIGLAQIIETTLATHKISRLIIKVRGKGGIKSDRVGPAAQIIIKMLARDKYEIIQIEDVTPIFYGKKTKYGRRGRKV